MPLVHGESRAAVGENVRREEAAGVPQAQAVAVALREARGATLRRVAREARVGHKVYLAGKKVEDWPAALDAAGASELAEQVRNVLARGPVGKKNETMDDAKHLRWMQRMTQKHGVDRQGWPFAAKVKHVKWLDAGGYMGSPSEEAIRAEVYAKKESGNVEEQQPKKARKPSASKDEREAKRRADRRIAEDKANDLQKEREALLNRRIEAQRECDHLKKKVKDLDKEIKDKGKEIVAQNAKAKRLS